MVEADEFSEAESAEMVGCQWSNTTTTQVHYLVVPRMESNARRTWLDESNHKEASRSPGLRRDASIKSIAKGAETMTDATDKPKETWEVIVDEAKCSGCELDNLWWLVGNRLFGAMEGTERHSYAYGILLQRLDEAETCKSELRKMLDYGDMANGDIRKHLTARGKEVKRLLQLLLRCYDAGHRHGWEPGETTSDVMEDVSAVLYENGLANETP